MVDTFDGYPDNALAKLRALLPARLEAIAAAAADGVELKAPNDDGVSRLGSAGVAYSLGAREIVAYPWVEVALLDAQAFDWSIGQEKAMLQPVVIVRALYRHTDVDVLDRALKRYGTAILQVLAQPHAFGQSVMITTAQAAWRTNPETEAQEQLVGAVAIRFQLDDQAAIPQL